MIFLRPLFAVICINTAEESHRVKNRVNTLMDLSSPHEVFWTDKSKASIIVKFQDRVDQIRDFFVACQRSLAMVNKAMFPLNSQPKTLIALMSKFKNPAEVKRLVRQ